MCEVLCESVSVFVQVSVCKADRGITFDGGLGRKIVSPFTPKKSKSAHAAPLRGVNARKHSIHCLRQTSTHRKCTNTNTYAHTRVNKQISHLHPISLSTNSTHTPNEGRIATDRGAASPSPVRKMKEREREKEKEK